MSFCYFPPIRPSSNIRAKRDSRTGRIGHQPNDAPCRVLRRDWSDRPDQEAQQRQQRPETLQTRNVNGIRHDEIPQEP
jgi:hypothetical protein